MFDIFNGQRNRHLRYIQQRKSNIKQLGVMQYFESNWKWNNNEWLNCRRKIEFYPIEFGVVIQQIALQLRHIFIHIQLWPPPPPREGGHGITTPTTDMIWISPLSYDPTCAVLYYCRDFSFSYRVSISLFLPSVTFSRHKRQEYLQLVI